MEETAVGKGCDEEGASGGIVDFIGEGCRG